MTARLHSIQVGKPREAGGDQPYITGFYKHPVPGPILLSRENLHGDRQADLTVHGGPDKAVCVYSADHYPFWRRELGVPECGPGWFGENFSLDGATEAAVAIGDTYRIGDAVVQVSQPRAPCWKLARRWAKPDMPKLVVHSGRTGWYVRVIETGSVEAGQDLTLLDRPFPQWTIEVVNLVAYSDDSPAALDHARGLAECAALAESWREDFRQYLKR